MHVVAASGFDNCIYCYCSYYFDIVLSSIFLQKTTLYQQKTQNQYERYVEVNTNHFQAWHTDGHVDVQKMREDLDRLGQKYFNSQDQYEKIKRQHTMIRDECEVMITLLKSVSNFRYTSHVKFVVT